MNREYNCKVSSKNSKRLLKNLQNTTGLLFLLHPVYSCLCLLLDVQHITEATRLNYEQNMHDAIAVFPRLQTGLDVNVKFAGYVHVFFVYLMAVSAVVIPCHIPTTLMYVICCGPSRYR